MIALFYDTETTGLPLYKEPSDHPDQPYIVQLAACLVDLDTRQTKASMDMILNHDVDIPPEVSKIHGIDRERANLYGVKPTLAISTFLSLWGSSTIRIGHNESFDARLVRIALKKTGNHYPDKYQAMWKEGKSACTMKLANPITKAHGSLKPKHKWPKLEEAYRILFDEELEGAHSAMPDVQACMRVYFHILDNLA